MESVTSVLHPEHFVLRASESNAPKELETLEAAERRHVDRVLAVAGGNKSEAARILAISRPRLDRLVKKYVIAV